MQLIQQNKGIEDILNEGYSEKIGVTVEQDGISITIDEVIADESGMIVAYEINSEQNLNQYEHIQIEVLQNNELIKAGYSYSIFMYEGEVVHQFAESVDIVASELKLHAQLLLKFEYCVNFNLLYWSGRMNGRLSTNSILTSKCICIFLK